MLPPPRRPAGPLALAGALGALFSAGAARAQINIASTVTPTGALFNYSYSVTNTSLTGQDFLVITLPAPSATDGLTDLTAPDGFKISFDPGVPGGGLVSFLEDTQVFSAAPAVFSFNSAFAPAPSQFQAVGFDSSGSGITASGPVLAPVPEASTFVSLGAGVLLLSFCAARRRRVVRGGTHS